MKPTPELRLYRPIKQARGYAPKSEDRTDTMGEAARPGWGGGHTHREKARPSDLEDTMSTAGARRICRTAYIFRDMRRGRIKR